jgi:hypothetical protein
MSRVEFAPTLQRHDWPCSRCGLGQFALRCAFVKLHRIARAMDNENPLVTGGSHHLVHALSHFGDPVRCALAPVFIPHVADDDGRFAGLAIQEQGRAFEAIRVFFRTELGASLEAEPAGSRGSCCRPKASNCEDRYLDGYQCRTFRFESQGESTPQKKTLGE